MRCVRLCLAAAAAALSVATQGQTIGPVSIGQHRESLSPQPNEKCSPVRCAYPSIVLGDTLAEMYVQFDGSGKVDGIIVTVSVGDGESLLRAATAKLGKPTADRTAVVQNGFGATFDQRYVRWPNADFVLRKADDLNESELVVMSKKLATQRRADERRQTRL